MARTALRKIQTPVRRPRQSGASIAKRPKAEDVERRADGGQWTFLTNHAHVLILLAENPLIVLREVAALVGITERAVQRIVADLQGEGYIEREKVGRQNRYRIRREQKLRHTVEAHRTIGDLLRIIDNSK